MKFELSRGNFAFRPLEWKDEGFVLLVFDLQKEGGGIDDIDANGQEVFEEYEWAGQTRIRATTLLEGGFRGTCNICFSLLSDA